MKRPNRYPYTRSQWVEKITTLRANDELFELRFKVNRVTGERK